MTQLALAPTSKLKLTRRGRNVLVRTPLALAGVAVLGAIGSAMTQPAQAETTSHDDGLTTISVIEGETLWGIAHEVAPQRATGDVVEEIRKLNHFTGPLQPGQKIVVPDEH